MATPTPKNVIWITTDHMRYDNIGAHGNAQMHTPNLDKLVNEGVSFDECYVQSPLCMPSRASFMSGLYPQQTQLMANGQTLPADFSPTVAKCFGAADFETTQIGKLHFQPHEDHDFDPRARNAYGFDNFWLSEEAGCYNDAYMTWLYTEHPELVNVFRVPRSTSPERQQESLGKVLDATWEASHSGWIANAADDYMKGRIDKNRRKFMHLGFYAPHPPLNPTREMFAPYENMEIKMPTPVENEWEDKPEPLAGLIKGMLESNSPQDMLQYRRHFYAMVTGVDMAIGRIMDALKRENVLDDTLIVFSSDHGDMCGDHGMRSKHTSYYDELLRVPCVMYWPNGFGKSGRRIRGMMEMVDLLPTMLGLCGATVPQVMAGRSYAEALLSGETPKMREDIISTYAPDWTVLRSKEYKYICYNSLNTEVLYDLKNDPGETKNIAKNEQAKEAINEMRYRMLKRSLEASRSPLPRNNRY